MRPAAFAPRIDSAPRILLVRLSSLRGVVQGLPVLCALRRHLPAARIAWLVEESSAAVLEGHAGLDRLICISRNALRSPQGLLRLRRVVRAERFDVAIDLQGQNASALAARLSGAAWRIGFGGDDGCRLGKTLNNDLVSVRARHVVEHYLALLRPLDLFDPPVEFGLPVWPKAGATVDRFMCRTKLLPGGFALVNAAAEHPGQQWPAGRYAAVAKHLGERHGLPTVAVWRTAADREPAKAILHGSGGWGVLSPAMSLQESAELARRAALFVGSDTGMLHLAVAVGTPTLSLHGTTRASWSGAYGPANVRLQSFCDEGSRLPPRAANSRAIQAISVDTVCAACTRLLLLRRPDRAQPLAA